jgi:hypothetical protein
MPSSNQAYSSLNGAFHYSIIQNKSNMVQIMKCENSPSPHKTNIVIQFEFYNSKWVFLSEKKKK